MQLLIVYLSNHETKNKKLTVIKITNSSSEWRYTPESNSNPKQMVESHGYSLFTGWGIAVRVYIIVILILASAVLVPSSSTFYNEWSPAYAAYIKATPSVTGPIVSHPNLKVQTFFTGLQLPTSMAFLGPDDILVIEKNKGTVDRIVDGKIVKQPLLHVSVATEVEHGMLGIAVAPGDKNVGGAGGISALASRFVFLYYTEAGATGVHNTLYRYELVDNHLVNPKLLLSLPAASSNLAGENSNHNGGKVVIGPDNNVYIVIGDVGGHEGQAQNIKNGGLLDGTSGILRVTQDGKPVGARILGNSSSVNAYYAYGIRNSFGMDFDPLTGKLWDTENGPEYGDEINIVDPGFNSGWSKIQGIWLTSGPKPGPVAPTNPGSKLLVDFDGKGKYRAPEFTWLPTIGPTALKFLNSPKLGSPYQNDLFVGDVNTGNLYHFKLNPTRDGLLLNGPLADKVGNTLDELQDVIFGQGFGTITDLQIGPDGYLYVLTLAGTIYRIVPSFDSSASNDGSKSDNNNSHNDGTVSDNTDKLRNSHPADTGGTLTPGQLHEVPNNSG
jgi:glucose/arabinose dehydrogenase